MLSTWFPGRGIRLLCCLLSLAGRLRFLLGFLPHLRFCFCLLLSICILWCWFVFVFSSFVSVIRATSAFVSVRSDSMLVIFLLIPVTFTVIIVSCLFFLILGLFVGLVLLSWFSFLPGIILILMGPNVTFFSLRGVVWCCSYFSGSGFCFLWWELSRTVSGPTCWMRETSWTLTAFCIKMMPEF